jgi:hypothetical protein
MFYLSEAISQYLGLHLEAFNVDAPGVSIVQKRPQEPAIYEGRHLIAFGATDELGINIAMIWRERL